MKNINFRNHEITYKILVEELLLKIESHSTQTFTFYINKLKPWQRTSSETKASNWKKARKITCYCKEVNEYLGEINKILSCLAEGDFNDDQYGFRTERGTLDITKMQQKKVICIDLKDAFHNISRRRIFGILKKYLTVSQARRLAKNMTPQGYMFQGHPIAPLILNLALTEALHDIKHVFGNTLKGFHYADDLNFFVDEGSANLDKNTLYSMAGKIIQILNSQGFKVNRKKISVYSSGNCWKTLGLKKEYKISYNKGSWELTPPRKLKRKVRMFRHWLKIGRITTQRKTKDGHFIQTSEVLSGILNYLNEVEKANNKPNSYRKHTGELRRFLEQKIEYLENPGSIGLLHMLNEADYKFYL